MSGRKGLKKASLSVCPSLHHITPSLLALPTSSIPTPPTMRFSFLLTAALAAVAIAAPTPTVTKRSLLTDLTGLIGSIEDGLGVTALEDGLDKLLGGSLSKVRVEPVSLHL